MKHLFLILLFTMQAGILFAQPNSRENFQDINEQIWQKFIDTYNNYDAEGFLNIHSKDLVRIPRDSRRISDFTEYFSRIAAWFENSSSNGSSQSISFTFLERFNNDKYGSEVGIYQVVSNPGSSNERVFYGKFHVILEKKEGEWKILVDSDTSENGTIGEQDFELGYKMDDLDPFVEN